jgi:hypothetical protein
MDTNVGVTANGNAPQASPSCIASCATALEEITQSKVIVLDDGWLILREYLRNLSSTGQPGPGDAFLKWVLTNHANPGLCAKVAITVVPSDPRGFAEFPPDPRLAAFDPSDRKFVAVALSHPHHPPILNAVDTDWAHYHAALQANGVTVKFLCTEIWTNIVQE